MPRGIHTTFNEYRQAWRKANPEKVAAQNQRARETQRAWRFRTEYKINLEKYNEMFQDQKGLCGICKRPQSDFQYRFAVDHDHKTQKIRGLLCMRCNTHLAFVEDSILFLSTKEYLRRYSNAVSL